MMKYIFILLFNFPLSLFSQSQYQHWEWAKSFGGSGNDSTTDMKIKNGFLYVTGIFTSPQINWDGTILTNHGGKDIFIAKLDINGNTIWVKSFGSTGDENVSQLEINSTGAMVIRCQSTSTLLDIDTATLNNPVNFFTVLDINGNILNAVNLPADATYPDIDIDNSNSIYISASYQHPFYFMNHIIDTSFGYAGAAILKYDALGNGTWYKNAQVRSNRREQMLNYNYDPSDSSSGPPFYYSSPVTGDAYASIKIEFNEYNSTLGIFCAYNLLMRFEDIYINFYQVYRVNLQLKISADGNIKDANFCDERERTSLGMGIPDFKTGQSGYTYTASGYLSTGGHDSYTITKEKDNIYVNKKEWWYEYNNYSTSNPPTAWIPFETDETGNYLLCTDISDSNALYGSVNKNVIVFDTSMNQIRETNVPEINRLPLLIKSMADTNAIFFGSTFSDRALNIDTAFPRASYILPNNGLSDIFIGKFAFKTCSASHTTQNIPVCYGSNYTFADNTVFNNIISDTAHTSSIHSVFGCDSIITTNINIIHIDTSVKRNHLEHSSNANLSSYQWIDCVAGTSIATANNQTYTVSSVGSYAVQITKEGCADTSACYVVTSADILAGRRQLVNLYPVPSIDHYTLAIQSDRPVKLNITLLDFEGAVIQQRDVHLIFGKNIITQNISALAAGTYKLVLRRQDNNETVTKVIIKL